MIKKIVCQNQNGNQISFQYAFPFFLTKLEGVTESSAQISTIKSAFAVGTNYQGTSKNERNITIGGSIKRDGLTDKRNMVYKMFPYDEEGTFFYYEDNKSYKIKYYVEDIKFIKGKAVDNFVISLKCPNPYFTDLEETQVSMANWIAGFEFPLIIPEDEGIEFGYKNVNSMVTIENDTNISIGMRIVFTTKDSVSKPTLINVNTQEELKINMDLVAGDVVTITTSINNKNILLTRNGVTQNINNRLVFGTKFLQIHCGSNTFKAQADVGEDNLTTEIFYEINYEAV